MNSRHSATPGNSIGVSHRMCEVKCPVGINTGELVKSIRNREMETAAPRKVWLAWWREIFGAATSVKGRFLNTVSMAHGILGDMRVEGVSGMLNKATGNMIPVWNPYIADRCARASGTASARADAAPSKGIPRKVVYPGRRGVTP